MKRLEIIGASGHGKVVADIAKKVGYGEIIFLDDDVNKSECGGYPVVGCSADFKKYDCDMIVAIGNAEVRQRIQEQLENAKKKVITLIHPNATIGENVRIGNGTVIMAGAVVNSGSEIGKGCIINTCASVDHDCQVGEYVHISVGAHLAGTITVGKRTWVGIGAVISNNLEVADDCMIGAGAVVTRTIERQGIYIGTPARKIK